MDGLLSPRAEAWRPQQKPVWLSDPLEGKVVGILNNGWSSMHVMTEHMAAILKERYGVAEVLAREFPASNSPPPGLINELAERSAAVIVGLAN